MPNLTCCMFNPTPSPPVDYEEISSLIHRIAQADHRALTEFHQRFSNMLFGIAFQVLHHAEDSEDVVQEVFTTLWNKAQQYSDDRGKPTSWLMALARNKAIDKLRSRERRNRLNDGFQQTPEMAKGWEAPSPAREVEVKEISQQLRSAVMQLNPEQQRAIQLSFFEGHTQSEIAERTGAPIGTVKARIRRGLGKLRDLVEP